MKYQKVVHANQATVKSSHQYRQSTGEYAADKPISSLLMPSPMPFSSSVRFIFTSSKVICKEGSSAL